MTISNPRRSQAWFRPGRYVPVSYVRGLEVLSDTRGGVRLGDGTLHGTAPELRALARQMLRAADVLEGRSSTAGGRRAALALLALAVPRRGGDVGVRPRPPGRGP